MDEKRAVRALKQKDSEALAWIIGHYAGYINTIVYNIIGHAMTAPDIEEVASDVFFAFWRNAEKVEERKLKAYLGSIARSKAKDKLRELDKMLTHEEYARFLQTLEETGSAGVVFSELILGGHILLTNGTDMGSDYVAYSGRMRPAIA